MSKIDIYNTNEKFDIIYTDPPWKQTKGGKRKSRPNQGKELDYQTISMDEIKNIHKHVKDNICNDIHTVFMWTIDKYLHKSEQMMNELGYKLHARLVWDKTNGIAPAFTVRYSHEYLLWFYQPKMLKIDETMRGKYTTVFQEKATKHSKKPIAAYEMIDNLYPNASKLELFARSYYDGWSSWGNEI